MGREWRRRRRRPCSVGGCEPREEWSDFYGQITVLLDIGFTRISYGMSIPTIPPKPYLISLCKNPVPPNKTHHSSMKLNTFVCLLSTHILRHILISRTEPAIQVFYLYIHQNDITFILHNCLFRHYALFLLLICLIFCYSKMGQYNNRPSCFNLLFSVLSPIGYAQVKSKKSIFFMVNKQHS